MYRFTDKTGINKYRKMVLTKRYTVNILSVLYKLKKIKEEYKGEKKC